MSEWTVSEVAKKSNEWDRDEYHIRATNDHDHSEVGNLPRSFKVPQSLMAQFLHWKDHPLTPYNSWADVVRDALVHRFAYLASRDGALQEFSNANNFEAMLQKIAAQEAFEDEMQNALSMVIKRAEQLVKKNDVRGLEMLLAMAKSQPQVDPEFRVTWLEAVEDIEGRYRRLLPELGSGEEI